MTRTIRPFLTLLVALGATAAMAGPMGYSVNSDAPNGDTLHRLDLATGEAIAIGKVMGIGDSPSGRTDIEGLAFSPEGVLWGVDEESRKLFPIDTGSGMVISERDVGIGPLDALRNNDFGMTFTCAGDLYLTSVVAQTLYQVSLDGTMTPVGEKGALGARISALAAWGNPAKLYGLGNGVFSDGSIDSRSLYGIDADTGTATLIGNIGAEALDYFEAGLSFDDEGRLWALTDRGASGSQVLLLDTETGVAESIAVTEVTGFESLAVAPPAGCADAPPGNIPPGMTRSIPTLGAGGSLLAMLLLFGLGCAALRGRPF